MMKKPLLFFVFISLIFLSFTSCSKKQSPQELEDKVNQLMGLESAKELPIQEAEAVSIPSTKELIEEHKKKSSNINEDNSKIDLDLTKMSATMIYTTVFDMLIMPEEYQNKNIKVSGFFYVFVNELTGEKYFAVIIPDATQCCQQGLEFIWMGDHNYPQDYPEIGQEIEITGRYQIIENEEGVTYTYLKVSNLQAL